MKAAEREENVSYSLEILPIPRARNVKKISLNLYLYHEIKKRFGKYKRDGPGSQMLQKAPAVSSPPPERQTSRDRQDYF